MEHTSTLWAAIHDALNLTGVGSLITGVFLITRGRSDARLTAAQLEQAADAAERDDMRDDRKHGFDVMERSLQACRTDRDYFQVQWKAAQTELDMRNSILATIQTNFPELSSLVILPGAMDALRRYRKASLTEPPSRPI
jgi:hypothetical protein